MTQPTAGLGADWSDARAANAARGAYAACLRHDVSIVVQSPARRCGLNPDRRSKARRQRPRNPWPRGNSCRPRRSGYRRPCRASESACITSSPITLDGISFSPMLSRRRTMPVIMRSTRSRFDGALSQRVMDRALQLLAVERLAPAGLLDHGQLAQLHALERREAPAAGRTQAPAPDGRVVVAKACCPSPGCRHVRRTGSAWLMPFYRRIDRKSVAERDRRASSRCLRPRDRRLRPSLRAHRRLRRSSCRSRGTPPTPKPRVVPAGDAQPDARGDRRLFGVERNRVLVAGDVGAIERLFGRAAGRPSSGRRSTSIRCVSVPPETISRPSRLQASRPAPSRSRPRRARRA